MADLLFAVAFAPALFLPAMSPVSCEDESRPSFCGSTDHTLSAIQKSDNGIYSDNPGRECPISSSTTCKEEDWNEGKNIVEGSQTPINVDQVATLTGGSWNPVTPSSGDPEVYTVPAGQWSRVEVEGGEANHLQRGKGLETYWDEDCWEPADCPLWRPQAWHVRRNYAQPYQYNTGEIPGDDNWYLSAPDEESGPAVEPGSCECPYYRCHELNTLWVKPPLPEHPEHEEIVDIHIWREPTLALDEAETKHIQLHVEDNNPTIVERDFYITPSAAAAGFGQDDVHDLVDGVNDMLKSEFEHDPSDEYVGAPRDYDSKGSGPGPEDYDGELDSSRGRYDLYVPVEFQVGEVTIWNGDESFPSYLESEFADYDYVLDTGLRPMETKKDYVIAPNDSKWQSTMDKAVIVTKNFWVHVGYHSSGDTPVMDTAPEGWAHLCSCDEQCTLECPCCEGSYCDGYNTQVVVQYDVEPTVLLHEWGHNTGLRHIKPEGDSEMGYPKEGHKSNHMIIPAPDTMSSWISEEELLPLNPGGPDYIQYHRWMNTPQDW